MAKDTMPKPSDGVYRRTDSMNWQWRIKVPKDLHPLYGKKQWAHGCSLKTSDVREANRKAAQLRAHWLETFEQQRQQASTTAPEKVEHITPEMAKALADSVKHMILDIDERVRTNPKQWAIRGGFRAQLSGMPEHLADTLSETNREQVELLSVAVARNRLEQARPVMESAAAELGVAVDKETPGYVEALKACLHALKDAYTLGVQRDRGEIVHTPPAPSLAQIEAKKHRHLRDVFDLWKASKDDDSDNVRKKAAALKLYEEHTGNAPLHELRREQGEAFKTWLLLKQDWSSKTKHDKLDAVKVLLNYASRDLEWLVKNPWESLSIPYKTENKRKPWTAAHLETFFALPLFKAYQLPKPNFKNGGAAAYWIPLLGLFTGARIGELAQLRVVDVVEIEGVWCISINDDGEGATVKSEAGQREVPIHSELLRLGFLEYVATMREAREDRLWPGLKFRNGKPGGYFSQWFGEFRKEAAPDVPDFHSLRHTVRSKMTKAGIAEQVQDRITGHESKGSIGTKVYGSHHDAEMLRDAVEAITYPGLTLPKMFQATAEEAADA